MGALLSALIGVMDRLGSRETNSLLLGLDAAGKTTLLYKLKLGETIATIPTIGFNMEMLSYKRMKMSAWDVGGQEKIRRLWRHYFSGAENLIFVVDSADPDRFDEVAEELHRVLSDPEMDKCSNVLIYANKQDLPGAVSAVELASALQVESIVGPSRKWFVQSCVATTGDGLFEGLDWLATQVCSSKPR